VTMNLEHRVLGRTGVEVSVMGLGSGGPSQLGQRQGADVESVRRLLSTGLDRGINLIDTAPGYGSSEPLLGEALRGFPRDDLVMCSKFNPFDSDGQIRPEAELRESLEASLRHLHTDRLEIFYLHAPPAGSLGAVMDVFGGELRRAVEDGLIRFTGVSEQYFADHLHETVIQGITDHAFDVVMVGYNMLSPSARSTVFPLALAHDVGVVIMCAIRGVIANPAQLEAVIRNWARNGWIDRAGLAESGPLDWLLEEADSIAAAAYKFAAEPDAVGCVLTGTASPSHLVDNLNAISGPPLSQTSVERLIGIFGTVGRNVGPADASE
jgi:aryl-alcohol dehydrogenase-like predicted oxidoreductase